MSETPKADAYAGGQVLQALALLVRAQRGYEEAGFLIVAELVESAIATLTPIAKAVMPSDPQDQTPEGA